MKSTLLLLLITMRLYAQPVIYPLNIGDTWQYRNASVMTSDTFVYSYKVMLDTLIGGKTYSVTFLSKNQVSIQRQSGDSIFLYMSGFGKELLYFDFSRTIGDTVSTTIIGNDTMDVTVRYTGTANTFGTVRRIWTFYVNRSRTTIDDEYSVTVADGIGVVRNAPDFGDPMALSGGVIKGTQYGVVLGVQDNQQLLPGQFNVAYNFPNPFNPTTTIRFVLPQSSHVTLEVYNNAGQIVDRRFYSRLAAGSHDEHFDASSLPSGVYFCRITSAFGIAIRKMVLAK